MTKDQLRVLKTVAFHAGWEAARSFGSDGFDPDENDKIVALEYYLGRVVGRVVIPDTITEPFHNTGWPDEDM